MRTALSGLTLLRPRGLAEALRWLRDDDALTPLAGCTDLYVTMNFGTARARRFVDLWGLRGLAGVRRTRAGLLRIGALTTFAALRRDPLVAAHLPILAEAARQIGGAQIQNRATIGGNVANASPAGDSLPVLAVAEAVVVLAGAAGERRLPYAGFHTGYRTTARAPGELIVAFEIPPIEGRQWFRKVGTRAANAISKIVVAGVRGPRPRVAFGSVAPTVVRAPRAEAALAAGGEGALAGAQAALATELAPIDDLRSTAAYRAAVAGRLLAQFWQETVS